MKTAKELYQREIEDHQGFNLCVCDYQPMLSEIGKIVVQVDDDDYQGDSRVLYYDGGKVGFLNFGWGSCSGCDALQACDNIQEVQGLFDDLVNDVHWFDSPTEAREYFDTKDWELEYYGRSDMQREFIEKAISFLEGLIAD